MNFKIKFHQNIAFVLMIATLTGCTAPAPRVDSTSTAVSNTPTSSTPVLQPSTTPKRNSYEFPDPIDPNGKYLIYLHGKIIEDQGIPAISPDFGEYEYHKILETLSGYGFVVISEQRPKNTDGVEYASKVRSQIRALLDAGVPAKDITVVGASKGGGIAIYVSHFLRNKDLNYVIMGICHPDVIEDLLNAQISLYGNVLSIYDSIDDYAGSCKELFEFSDRKDISRYDEIVLKVGTGHGILYQPIDEWVLPAVEWANSNAP